MQKDIQTEVGKTK